MVNPLNYDYGRSAVASCVEFGLGAVPEILIKKYLAETGRSVTSFNLDKAWQEVEEACGKMRRASAAMDRRMGSRKNFIGYPSTPPRKRRRYG